MLGKKSDCFSEEFGSWSFDKNVSDSTLLEGYILSKSLSSMTAFAVGTIGVVILTPLLSIL